MLSRSPRTRRTSMRETEKIWMNGELVDWGDARIHVGAHGLHYGSGVFEGIRAYETDKGSAVFRLTDHLQRLHNSARLLHMELPYSVEELRASCHELIAANGLPECYLRPIAFFGYGELGVSALGITLDTVIQIAQDLGYRVHEKALIRSDLYLADEAFMTGTAAEVTPLRSVDDVEIGVGPITLEIQEAYLDTARGRSERWAQWLEYATPTPAEA